MVSEGSRQLRPRMVAFAFTVSTVAVITVFIWWSLSALCFLVHNLRYEGLPPGVVWQTLEYNTLVPWLIAVSFLAWFTLDGWLRHRENRGARQMPTAARLWLAATFCVVGVFTAFCVSLSDRYPVFPSLDAPSPFLGLLLGFNIALLLGAVAADESAPRVERLVAAILPPLAVIIGVYSFGEFSARLYNSMMPITWPIPSTLVLVLAAVAGLSLLAAIIEIRFLSTWRRTVLLVAGLLWLLAAGILAAYFAANEILMMTIRPHPEYPVAVAVILGGFAVATVARLLLYRHRRSCTSSTKPPDSP